MDVGTGNEHDTRETQATPPPVGVTLRQAREGRGLSQLDVARELRLSVAIVDALERDRYERLPAPIFVQGYLRSYAQLVDVPEEPVVEAFLSHHAIEPSTLTPVPTLSERRFGMRAPTAGMLWVVLLVSLAALVAAFGYPQLERWIEWRQAPRPAAGGLQLPPPVAESARELPEPAPSPPAEVMDPGREFLERETAALEHLAREARTEPETVAVPEPPPVAVPAEVPLPPALDRLQLTMHADSWVEVRDAGGTRLLAELVRAGQQRSISGDAPFTVLLGNSPGVEVRYNGEPFDQSGYNRDNVARFEIGG